MHNMASITARETVYQIIRNKIITLALKPGETLNDKELAEELGVSRTPVREALILLNASKLVVVRPQSGTFVAPIDLELAEEEQFARYALEKEMIQRTGSAMTQEQRNRFAENLKLYEFYEHSQVPGKEQKLLELDNEFHRISFLIDGKEKHFVRMLDNLHHIERVRILSLMVIHDDQVYGDHVKIVDALMKRNTHTAEYWLEEHLNRYRLHILRTKRMFPQYFSDDIN